MAPYKKTKYDIRAGVFGFAIGDALGVPVKEIPRKNMEWYPVNDYELCRVDCPYSVVPGTYSAHTALVLALMDSLSTAHRLDLQHVMERYAECYSKQKYTANGITFGLGREISQAIESFLVENRRIKFSDNLNVGNTNGSLLRILPIAFICHDQALDPLIRLRLIKDVSSLTHSHAISIMGNYIYVNFIDRLMSGDSPREAYQAIRKDQYWSFHDKTRNAYRRLLESDISKHSHSAISSGEYITDTLEAAIWSLLTTDNFRDAVLKAVNLGHDSNSIGALTGAMAGIAYGYKSIPRVWIVDLERGGMVQKYSDRFAKALRHIRV